jgi:O-antigen/teichoic acid export membrane protein
LSSKRFSRLRPGELVARTRDFAARKDKAGVARRSAAIALVIRLTSAALAYLAQVVFARLMGQYEYGAFAYTWVWFLVFAAVATLGFGDSPVRYVAQLRARGEDDYLRGFIRFAPLTMLAASVAFALLLIAVLPFMGGLIENVYLMPMALMAISIPFACLQSYFEGLGRSYDWTIPALLPNYILRHGLLLLIMVAAVHLGFEATAKTGFVCLIAAMTISIAYQATTILYRLRKVLPSGPVAYRPKEWVKGSAPFAVLYAAQHLSSFADVLVLSFFVSPAKIAVYFAATRIIQVVNLIPYAATVGTAHLFSASHTRGDHAELQRLCRSVAATTFTVATIAVAAMVMLGDKLLEMFGHGFAEGYTPLVILAAGVFARVAAGPAEDMLNMTGHSKVSASTYLAIVAINVPLAVAFVIPFGLNGAAAASAIALTLRALWLSYAVWKRLGVRTSILAVLAASGLARIGAHGREIRTPAE